MKLTILVGPPGSGKSTYAKSISATYINQDIQGKQHLELFQEALARKETIVVDRMNFNREQRERYLKPAKELGYQTQIIVFHESKQTCMSRMVARENHTTIKTKEDASRALNFFFKSYERPITDEADDVQFKYPTVYEQCIVVDLDGTLCNIDHRLHHVRRTDGKKKDWKAFFEDLDKDTVNTWCKDIIDNLYQSNYHIVLASGRSDDYERKTELWLNSNNISYDNLFMRPRNDFREDYIVKEIILDFEILTRYNPIMFIDDRQQVIDLWRRRGFVALQCAMGDF